MRQSSKASALSDVSERKASKTNSLGNARMSRLNSMGATAGLSQSLLDVDVELQAEDMAPAALQTHLTQWRSWRREGRLPSAPVHLPPAPIAQHPTKAAPVRQNSGSAAQPPAGLHLDISVPSRAINEYLRDFRDQDLDGPEFWRGYRRLRQTTSRPMSSCGLHRSDPRSAAEALPRPRRPHRPRSCPWYKGEALSRTGQAQRVKVGFAP